MHFPNYSLHSEETLQIQFEYLMCTFPIAFSSLLLMDNHSLKFCDHDSHAL